MFKNMRLTWVSGLELAGAVLFGVIIGLPLLLKGCAEHKLDRHYRAAIGQVVAGEYDSARDELRQAVDARDDYPYPWALLAKMNVEEGRYDVAAEQYATLKDIADNAADPDHMEAVAAAGEGTLHLHLALVAIRENRNPSAELDLAEQSFTRARSELPEGAIGLAHVHLVRTWLGEDGTGRADSELRGVLDSLGPSGAVPGLEGMIDLYTARGILAQERGEHDEALQWLFRAYGMSPLPPFEGAPLRWSGAYRNYAYALARNRVPDGPPEEGDPLDVRVEALFAQFDDWKVTGAVETALFSADPTYVLTLMEGDRFLAAGRYAQAAGTYEHAVNRIRRLDGWEGALRRRGLHTLLRARAHLVQADRSREDERANLNKAASNLGNGLRIAGDGLSDVGRFRTVAAIAVTETLRAIKLNKPALYEGAQAKFQEAEAMALEASPTGEGDGLPEDSGAGGITRGDLATLYRNWGAAWDWNHAGYGVSGDVERIARAVEHYGQSMALRDDPAVRRRLEQLRR